MIDARSGLIVRFVPAYQSGGDYEGMRYEGPLQPAPGMPRASLDNPPPPTVIKADPNLLQATPNVPPVPHNANRTAALAPTRPVAPMPAARPVMPASPQTASVAPPQATPEQKPAAQILPTDKMPPAQGLE